MAVNLMITDPYYYAHRIGQELPSIFWPQEVSKLHPIKVYFHRENVFIVISRNTKEERGYCVPPFSSAVCVPDFETDGWIWKNITNGFYEYRKDLRNAVFANQ